MVARTQEPEPTPDGEPLAAAESLSYIYLMVRELAPMAQGAGADALAAKLAEAASLAAEALARR